MHLYAIPLIFALIGLVLYTVLAGADFGAGIWQLTAGGGERGEAVRDHAHHAMAPVWEANHVWLIFVLTVIWSAYPAAFGSIASTLSIALFLAALGIILRGATYALRSGARSAQELRAIDMVFALASLLTPFALGAAVGGIAAGRVPLGNASGHLFSSWLNPTSVAIGVLAIATAAYLAAVFLAADAQRLDERALQSRFRTRALLSGLIAGAIAIGSLFVLKADATPIYHHLISGAGLPALIVSIVAGVLTLALVWASRFELARYSAALAVAAIVAGWALAQQPRLLPGLTIAQAAAPHDALVLVTVIVPAGGAILFPSLALLFGLLLKGRLDPHATPPTSAAPPPATVLAAVRPGLLGRSAFASLVAGAALLVFAESSWAQALGVVLLAAFIVLGFAAARPAELARHLSADDAS
ncbi:MAG TPA: cytochrome d ubiquinol oxidase subunit II [Solirubrobacteraceae bacterium]|jgi:cytochrome d ubiquinol oxidase subunit II